MKAEITKAFSFFFLLPSYNIGVVNIIPTNIYLLFIFYVFPLRN